MSEVNIQDWHGCYDEGWGDLIVPEAFAHPAKFSYGLIQRIIAHGAAQGYWKPGDTLGDPFGGIGTGGIIASRFGLRFIGVELESRFCRMAMGHECPGVTKAEWVRWYGRFNRNPNLCPKCQTSLAQIRTNSPLFGADGDGHYYGHGQIPWKSYHHYIGNFEHAGAKGAQIIQGDSRRFSEIVCDGIVTSPPFVDFTHSDHNFIAPHDSTRLMDKGLGYGENTPGQIGRLPPGNVDSVITSPPYAESIKGEHGETETAKESRDKRQTEGGSLGQSQRHGGYGSTEGNLGNLKEGQLGAVVTSPPFVDDRAASGRKHQDLDCNRQGYASDITNAYGSTPGNIGNLKGCVTSPPHARSMDSIEDVEARKGRADGFECGQKNLRYAQNPNTILSRDPTGLSNEDRRAIADGNPQIGQVREETYWQAVAQVYSECTKAIQPGGVMAVVIKDYVKNKARVPLCDQTWELLQRVGFKPLERIRAWLVKETETDGLFGTIKTKKERKSFFRRLAESKGSPRIDWEEVLFLQKGKDVEETSIH